MASMASMASSRPRPNTLTTLNALAVLSLLASLSLAHASPVVSEEALMKAAKMMRGMCQPKSGASDDQLTALSAGKIADERQVKCYIACLMSTARTIKKGKIDAKMVKFQAEKLMPPDKRDAALEALAACKDVGGADDCELAYNYLTCTQKVNPEKYFFPV